MDDSANICDFQQVNGQFESINGNKYLSLVPTKERK